ncbi:Peptidyl-prolyl cis-trans isomerase fpr2 [Pyricularia oryzae]|nr:Peptidyl-prolyl cis-trans isomerase fpr2 [Pyricularia oryzae]
MKLLVSLSLLASAAVTVLAADELGIEVTQAVNCERKTKNGDMVHMHYKGTLQSTDDKFDASYDRGTPLAFPLGTGRVIKGWDQGLLDMCIGEKRTLTIPPSLGYGDGGIGPIPGGATLIFETELVSIDGVETPEKIDYVSKAEEAASKATEKVAEKVADKIKEAAEVVKTVVADSDDAGQEHNEL